MEMNIKMGINRKSQLSTTVYNSLQSFVEFKAYFHHIYINPRKDPTKTWHELPYLVTEDVIFAVLESWPLEWCTPASFEIENFSAQWKKDKAKSHMMQLAEKHRNKVEVAKAQVACDVVKLAEEQQKETEEAYEGEKSFSPEQETDTEQGGANPQTASTQLK